MNHTPSKRLVLSAIESGPDLQAEPHIMSDIVPHQSLMEAAAFCPINAATGMDMARPAFIVRLMQKW